jgi:hypothetical protein
MQTLARRGSSVILPTGDLAAWESDTLCAQNPGEVAEWLKAAPC